MLASIEWPSAGWGIVLVDSCTVGLDGSRAGSRHLAHLVFNRQGDQDRQDLREGHLIAVLVK